MKFEVYKGADGQWRWRLKARNGRVIADSGEAYKQRARCLGAIVLLKTRAPEAAVETVKEG